MFESLEQSGYAMPDALDALLRQGLREMPTPVVSAEFNDRVMQAIHRPRPWWWIDWQREGTSLVAPGATAIFACIATLGVILWTGAAGPVRFTPNRVVQNMMEAALQAADSGKVSAATVVLRSPRVGGGASSAQAPLPVPAVSKASLSPKAGEKRKSVR